MANQLGSIKHIVQPMLENRSFEQMLGFLCGGNKSPTTGQALVAAAARPRLGRVWVGAEENHWSQTAKPLARSAVSNAETRRPQPRRAAPGQRQHPAIQIAAAGRKGHVEADGHSRHVPNTI
jgi:phospholipase C